jgi:uncharacterized protein YecT (DUF1311 family)
MWRPVVSEPQDGHPFQRSLYNGFSSPQPGRPGREPGPAHAGKGGKIAVLGLGAVLLFGLAAGLTHRAREAPRQTTQAAISAPAPSSPSQPTASATQGDTAGPVADDDPAPVVRGVPITVAAAPPVREPRHPLPTLAPTPPRATPPRAAAPRATPARTTTVIATPEATNTASRPAFHCDWRLRISERMVCDDPTLAALDQQLNRAFGAAVRAGAPRAELRAEQDAWVFRRDAVARRSPGALADYYRARIAHLDALAR